MNKKATRSNVWYLLPKEALENKNLTTSDRNVLSVLVYLSQAFGKKFFRLREQLLEDIKDSEFELSDKQVTRCLAKLQHFGFITYKPGYHNNTTGKGSASEFELTYSVDNQSELENNVHPNTNTKTNTNTNSKANAKIKSICISTDSISTLHYKDGVDKTDWVAAQYEAILKKGGDNLALLEWLEQHPEQSNYEKLADHWSEDPVSLGELNNWWRYHQSL